VAFSIRNSQAEQLARNDFSKTDLEIVKIEAKS